MSERQSTNFYERTRCRLCNELRDTATAPMLKLPSTPLANSFMRSREEALSLEKFPLEVYACSKCGHHQLGHVVDPGAMFTDYAYASGTSESFRKHFDGYASEILKRYPNAKGFVELGSNDGTMMKALKHYGGLRSNVIGIEPAKNLADKCISTDHLNVINEFFDLSTVRHFDLKADFWTANNVLAHIDQFVPTLTALAETGAQAGVFEVQYLGALLDGGMFDMAYHEHVDYWRFKELYEHLHEHTPWAVVDVETVPTHGGSLRVWVERVGDEKNPPQPSENASALHALEQHRDWPLSWAGLRLKMENERNRLWSKLGDLQRVAVFGAPAKLTTLLYGMQLQNLNFAYVVDDSPLKQGLFTPGMGLEVCSENRLLEDKPDVVLVGAWNFAAHIVPRVKEMLPDVKVVVPFQKSAHVT